MKLNLKKSVALLVAIVIFLLPFGVKADDAPLDGKITSEDFYVGSNLVFTIRRGSTKDLKGTVSFDQNILEVVEVRTDNENAVFECVYTVGTLTKTIKDGQVIINYDDEAENSSINVEVVFKVKAYPTDGKTTIKFTQTGDSWLNNLEKTINIKNVEEETKTECIEQTCPECEECKTCPDETTTTNTNASYSNIMIYAPWAISGVLAAIIVIILLKKKTI